MAGGAARRDTLGQGLSGASIAEGEFVMPTVVLIIVTVVVIAAIAAAVLVQRRRTSNRPFGPTEADASSANQRRDDRQGWS